MSVWYNTSLSTACLCRCFGAPARRVFPAHLIIRKFCSFVRYRLCGLARRAPDQAPLSGLWCIERGCFSRRERRSLARVLAMPSALKIVVLSIITVAVCASAGFGISYYTKAGQAAPAMWVGLTVGGAFGLGLVAGYAVAMQHPSRSASGDLAAASPQADEVAWLPVMQHPSRGELFQTNVRLAAANDLKIAVNDRRRSADDDGLAVDDPSLDRAVNHGDGGLDQLFGAPKQALAAAAGGAPNTPTFDMRTAKPRSNLNSDVSPRSPGGSPRGSFLVGEVEESGSPRSERSIGRPRGSGKSPMISPSSTLSKGGSRGEVQQEAAVAAAAAAAAATAAPAAAATAATAAATAAARSPGAGLQLSAAQLRGGQGSTSPRSSVASSPRGSSTPKGWPPGKGPPAKAPPPGLPPAKEGRKSNATQANEDVLRSCISPRSQDGEEGGGRLSGSVMFSSASPSARRAGPDPGAAQQSAPGLPRPAFPSPPKRPSGQFSVPPVSLVQNAARTSQQKPSSRSSFDALTTPASQTFAAAAAALRQEEEEARQQALLRRRERLERAKSENDRRREAGSVRRESDGPSRSDDARHESPAHPA